MKRLGLNWKQTGFAHLGLRLLKLALNIRCNHDALRLCLRWPFNVKLSRVTLSEGRRLRIRTRRL